MCTVPSWITVTEGKKKTVLFVTDKDMKAHCLRGEDATGHTAIRTLFGAKGVDVGGDEGEGLNKDTPKEVRKAIAAGKFNRLAADGECEVRGGGRWVLPFHEVKGFKIEGGAAVVCKNLKKTGDIALYRGTSLYAPALEEWGDLIVCDGASIQVGKPRK